MPNEGRTLAKDDRRAWVMIAGLLGCLACGAPESPVAPTPAAAFTPSALVPPPSGLPPLAEKDVLVLDLANSYPWVSQRDLNTLGTAYCN